MAAIAGKRHGNRGYSRSYRQRKPVRAATAATT